MLLFLFWHLVVRCISWTIFQLKFILNLMLIFCQVFYLKTHLCYTEPFRKKSDGSHVCSSFLGNNSQNMPVSWNDFFLCKVHFRYCKGTSLGTLWGATVSSAFVDGISLVSILQADDWARVSTQAKHYFSTYIIIMDQHHASVQHNVLGLGKLATSWSVSNTDFCKSLMHMLGCSFPQYQANSFLIVCTGLLALYSLN